MADDRDAPLWSFTAHSAPARTEMSVTHRARVETLDNRTVTQSAFNRNSQLAPDEEAFQC